MNVQCGGGSGSLAKETRAWKMKNTVAGHQKLTMTNWELILLRLQDKLPKNSVLTILWLFGIWSKLKKVKKLRKWVHSWADWQSKNLSLSSVIFSYSAQQQIISYSLWWATKSGLYMTTRITSSVAGQRSSCKALPKARLAPKKGLVTVWWSAAGLIHCSSLSPSETVTSENYAQQMMRCTENCNVCSQHRSTEWAQFFSMPMPNQTSHKQCFKGSTNWATKFCLICHIHLTSLQLTTTSLSISRTFCKENTFTTSRMQKMLSKSLSNPKAQIFMLQE